MQGEIILKGLTGFDRVRISILSCQVSQAPQTALKYYKNIIDKYSKNIMKLNNIFKIFQIYIIRIDNISSKLRIAWEIHFRAVYISKNPKKTNFFGESFRIHVSFPRILILIMASDPSRRGSNFRCFLDVRRRKKNDILGIFLVGKNCVFSAGPKLFAQNNSKKSVFLGESSGIQFLSFFFFVVMFFYCAFWVVHDFRRTVRKNGFFLCPKNDVSSGARLRVLCLDHM